MADKLEPLAVSAAEAARLLGVSRPTIYQYIGRADFPSFKLGNRTLIYVDGLREWVKRQAQEVSAREKKKWPAPVLQHQNGSRRERRLDRPPLPPQMIPHPPQQGKR